MTRNTRVFCAALAALVLAIPLTAGAAKIVDHPDKLKYPKQNYVPPKADDYRSTLSNGIVTYMVKDETLPLVTVRVFMRIGQDLDPQGKEGLAQGVVHLLTRSGTANTTAQELEDRVAFLGAQLDSRMGPGGGGFFGLGAPPVTDAESRAEINLLSKDFDAGLQILVDCLKTPGFEQDRIDLARDQIMQQMKERNDDSRDIEEYQWDYLSRGEDHWTNRHPTGASVAAITRDDMIAFHQKYVGPKNFLITVSGNFDEATVKAALEKAFSGWEHEGLNPGPPAAPTAAMPTGLYMVDKEVNQGRVIIGLPAPDRYDPDWTPMQVMNLILGGGGFSSRLVNKIRSDEGLAYSVRSRFEGGHYYPEPWHIQFQSKVRSVPYAMQLAVAEIDRMKSGQVTDEELQLAKNLMIESLPAAFESADGISGVLAVEELTGRYQKDPGYFQGLRERVGKVSKADVQRVAQRLLDTSRLTILCVGDVEEIEKGDPKHDVDLASIAGAPKTLPLRDPMTMQPMANP